MQVDYAQNNLAGWCFLTGAAVDTILTISASIYRLTGRMQGS